MELEQTTTVENKKPVKEKVTGEWTAEEAAELRSQPDVVGLTPTRNVIRYRSVSSGAPLYELYFGNGGELPESLSGQWTTKRDMVNAVKMYEFKHKVYK